MGRTAPLRAFVERNLAELLEVPKVEPEPEGTYQFACGKTPIRVELNDESGMVLLHLLALLVQRPTKTNGRVLAFLNETNGMRIPSASFGTRRMWSPRGWFPLRPWMTSSSSECAATSASWPTSWPQRRLTVLAVAVHAGHPGDWMAKWWRHRAAPEEGCRCGDGG